MHNWRALVCQRLADAGIDQVADASLIEELAHHMEDRYAEARARGGSADDGFAAALRELDGHDRLAPVLARNLPAPIRPGPIGGPPLRSPLEALWQDFRYAGRTLRRRPGFTLAAVLTVALSTAPTIAVLSVGNWLFLRPMPGVTEPERLATVMFGVPSERGGLTVRRPSPDDIAQLALACPSIESMAGWQRADLSIATGNRDAQTVDGEFVSGNYFDVLGVRMFAGRSFFADEDRPPDGAPVAVISYRLSRALLGNISAVGAHVTINRYPVMVIGVAPPNFSGSGSVLNSADIWMPGQAGPMIQHLAVEVRRPDRGPFYEYVIRPAPGVSPERAGTELRTALKVLSQADSAAATLRDVQSQLSPGFAAPAENIRALIAALLGFSMVLVLIAAANLANMFCFRAVTRVHETALRRALGASSGRLFQATIAESLIVAAIGCLTGFGIVSIVQYLVGGINLAGGFYIPEIPFDWRLMGMTVSLAFCTGIFMGVSSARFSSRKDLGVLIAGSGRMATRTISRLRTGLAVVQMALSLTLLVGALLFIGTLRNLRSLDPGFDPKGITAYSMSFRTQGYTGERISLLYSELLERLSALPGITAAVAYGSPMFGGEIGMARNFNPLGDNEKQRYAYSQVSENYFEALGIALIAGQGIAAEETFRPGPETGVVISESLARHLYGENVAVGRILAIPATLSEPQHEVRIVGVAEDVRWDDLTEAPPFMIYRPIRAVSVLNSRLLVRSADPTALVIAQVRDTIKSLDPALPMQTQLMEEVVSLKLGQQRTFAWVLGLLAAIGFALAAIGIHGLVSQSVVERTREFGIRLAVGASPREIVRLVLRSALFIVAVGAPLGCALGVILALALRSRLFGVTPLDLSAYIAAVGALVFVVLTASLWPAYSASRVSPSDVLRAE